MWRVYKDGRLVGSFPEKVEPSFEGDMLFMRDYRKDGNGPAIAVYNNRTGWDSVKKS